MDKDDIAGSGGHGGEKEMTDINISREDMRVLIFENMAIAKSSLQLTIKQKQSLEIQIKSLKNYLKKRKKWGTSKKKIEMISASLVHLKNMLRALEISHDALQQQILDLKTIIEREKWDKKYG